MKIYLSAPDVFMRNEKEIGIEKKRICKHYGIKGVFPTENLDMDYVLKQFPPHMSQIMYEGNKILIKECDMILVNVSPFRGWSMDCGVAHEIGCFDMLEKPVYIYANTNLSLADRVGKKEDGYCENGYLVEDFNEIENLMIMRAATCPLFYSEKSKKKDLSAMESFKLAVESISRLYNLK